MSYDAILIPGGGVQADGSLPPWMVARLDAAITTDHNGCFITLSAGTVHKPPPLDAEGFPIFESVAATNYLIAQGIPKNNILVETCSYDTIGNAYFSYVIHVLPRRLKRLLVITSEFHLARTQAIFEWIYSLAKPDLLTCQLSFKSVPDVGIAPDVLKARQHKEASGLASLQQLMPTITTLEQFHTWLTMEHNAYTPGGKPERAAGSVLKTY
jgi:hypothetical protein